MQRRRFLAASAAAGSVALAGCSQPKPTVVSANAQGQLLGETKIEVVIENSGPAGKVTAVIETKSEGGTTLQQFTRTVQMDRGERRQVTWTVNLEEEAHHFVVTAKPVGFL